MPEAPQLRPGIMTSFVFEKVSRAHFSGSEMQTQSQRKITLRSITERVRETVTLPNRKVENGVYLRQLVHSRSLQEHC